MTYSFKDSLLCRFIMVLVQLYQESHLYTLIQGMVAWCNHTIETSRLMQVLCREGALAKAYPTSWVCRGLTWLANLPATMLHWLYRRFQPLWEGSFVARLGYQMGTETAIAQSWLILLLWSIPYERWNNAYTLMAFVLLLALFYVGSMKYESMRLNFHALGWYWVLMVAGAVLGVALSYSPALSARFLIYHLSAALCVLVTVSAVQSSRDLVRLVAGGAGCVIISSLYGIYQRIQGVEVNPSYVDLDLNADMPGRVFSFFENPNTFAQVLILLLPLVLALVLCSKTWLGRIFAGSAFVLGAAALGMTYSRASWVGMAVAMAMLVFFWKPKLIPLFVVAVVLCLPLLPDSIWNRILTITNFSDSSTASRIPLYLASIEALVASPFTGAGLGTEAVQAFIADNQFYHGDAPYVHAHNMYMQVWLETGIIGVVGFVGSLLWVIKRTGHVARHCASSVSRTMACGGAAALCGAMVCGLADYLWNYPRVMCIFWFVFAITAASVKISLISEK